MPRLLRRNRHRLAGLVFFLVLLGIWQLIAVSGSVDPMFVPSPGDVWRAFVDANSCREPEGGGRVICGEQNYFLWQHLVVSLERIGIGILAGVVVGVMLGLLMGTVKWARILLEPYLHFLRALPPLGYIGLLIVWFGIGDVSKIWLLFLAAFPPITIATLEGVLGVSEDRVLAARTLGASRMQTLWRVVIPSALPEILTGIRVAIGFAWTTVVAAELNNGIPGIGGLAYVSGTQLQTALTIACIIVIGIAAIILDRGVAALARWAVPWNGRA